MPEKSSHAVAQYGPGDEDGAHCAVCTMFVPKGPHCTSVVDPISRLGWCKYFKKKK